MPQKVPGAESRFDGSVAAAFPIALLESVRSHDRPGEILEDEDLTVSLPRRLGLTGVVDTQLRRYASAQREGRRIRLDETMGLVRLVMRRPDAEPILRETGQRIARWHFRRTPDLWRTILHRGPGRLATRSARRAAVRTLRGLRVGTRVVADKPYTIRVHDAVTTRLEEGRACSLLAGLLEEQLLLYTGHTRRVTHASCAGLGDEVCEWTLAPELDS
jgi:hypothetical protein